MSELRAEHLRSSRQAASLAVLSTEPALAYINLAMKLDPGHLAIVLVVAGCRACAPDSPPTTTGPFDAEEDCFTAVADAAPPAKDVFDEMDRTGNGETWLAILFRVLEGEATVGDQVEVPEMGFGWQHRVTFRGRSSWVGFDVEAGGAIVCTPDEELFGRLRSTYERARTDPQVLRRLVQQVPQSAWDD